MRAARAESPGTYFRPADETSDNLRLMARIGRQYTARAFFGSRRMTAWLRRRGHGVNRKRVQRLLGVVGLTAYHRPFDDHRPLVCNDEPPVKLVSDTRVPLPTKPGIRDRSHAVGRDQHPHFGENRFTTSACVGVCLVA